MHAPPHSRLILAVVGAIALAALPATGATITVNTTADTLANDGACSLREATIAANTNAPSGPAAGECVSGNSGSTDTILVPAGTFALTRPGAESDFDTIATVGDLDLTQSVNLIGAGALVTRIDAALVAARVMHIEGAAEVTLSDLTLSNGFDGEGGGLFQDQGGLATLTRVHVIDNQATGSGGGISAEDLILVECVVAGNLSGGGGGGGVIGSGDVLSVAETVVTGNQALGTFARGGGIRASALSFTLADSMVATNFAEDDGGGIYVESDLAVVRTSVHDNEAGVRGGGIYAALGANGSIQNSTVSGNTSADEAGGLGTNLFPADEVTLTHCTLTGNSAPTGSAIVGEDITVANTIVSGTCAEGPITSLGGNIESPGDNCGLGHATDQVAVSAAVLGLGPLGSHGGPTVTHLLLPPSAAIDSARASLCSSEDQRGENRPQGPGCDVGAVEVAPDGIFADGFDLGNAGRWSLQTP